MHVYEPVWQWDMYGGAQSETRVGVRYMYLYLGTVFQVPVPDPHEQEVPS